jgi:hypothetical protein
VGCVLLAADSTATNAAQADSTGTIVGQVVDYKTTDPLIGVSITLDGTDCGIASDAQGEFQLAHVRPGCFALTATYMGYKDARVTDTIVASCTTHVRILMKAQPRAPERAVTPPVYTGPKNWRTARMPDDTALVSRIESYFEDGRWPEAECYYAPSGCRAFAGFTLYGTVRDGAVTRACGWLVYCTYGIGN